MNVCFIRLQTVKLQALHCELSAKNVSKRYFAYKFNSFPKSFVVKLAEVFYFASYFNRRSKKKIKIRSNLVEIV